MFRNSFLLSVLIFTLVVAGCGQSTTSNLEGEGENKAQTSEQSYDQVQILTGSDTWLSIGTGIAEKTNELLEGFPVTAVPGAGGVGNPSSVSKGEADFGMSYGPFLLNAQAGNPPYEEQLTNLRAIAALPETVVHVFQNADYSVNSLQQLIENETKMTFGIPPVGSASNFISQIIFDVLGFEDLESTLDDWGSKVYYASLSNLIDAWRDRHIDAFMTTLNVPAPSVDEALLANEGKILNIGEELEQILVKEKEFKPYTIPAGTYVGQDEDIRTVSLPIILFAREDTPDELVYQITKAIYENKEYLEGVNSSFKEFEPQQMATGLAIEMHKGAEKFYKEVGVIN